MDNMKLKERSLILLTAMLLFGTSSCIPSTTELAGAKKHRETRTVLSTLLQVHGRHVENGAKPITTTDRLPELLEIILDDRAMGSLPLSADWKTVEQLVSGLKDAWGNPLLIKLENDVTILVSIGRDKVAGTTDDLSTILF